MRAVLCRWGACSAVLFMVAAGCAGPSPNSPSGAQLRQRAEDCLKRGLRYQPLPTVRAQAVEALETTTGEASTPWLRQALLDEHPAVRFAACMALGGRRDTASEPTFRRLLASDQPSDRVGATFALHRLGDSSHTAELAECLLDSPDPAARRHAAMVLGRLEESGAIKLLARVMNDPDPGLRSNALESMYLLGAEEAKAALYANAYGGGGAEEVFALNALAARRDRHMEKLFRDRLASGLYPETKLAAARALGLLGCPDGYATARRFLAYRAAKDVEGDPAENQTLRVRQLAALALGAIGDARALGALEQTMIDADDPRLQVSAAKAVLEILGPASGSPRAWGPPPAIAQRR